MQENTDKNAETSTVETDSEKETNQTADETANETHQAEETAETTRDVNWEEEAQKWKALSRKNEAAAKANAEKAKRLDEIEEANKTELQKAQEENERLKTEAREATLEAVASTFGVPAELITGETREDMESSAKKLQEWAGQAAPVTGSGVDAAGKRGEPLNTDQLTRKDLEAMSPEDIDKARKAGRLNILMGRN